MDLPQITTPQARKHCSNTQTLCRQQLFSTGQRRAVEEAPVPCLQPRRAEDSTWTLKPHTRGRRIGFQCPHSPEHCGQALRADARGVSSPQSNGLTILGTFHFVFQNSSGTQRGFYCATLPRTHLGRQHRLPSRCPSAFSARRVVSTQPQVF